MIDPAWFCSPFDAALALRGPPALFLLDPERLLRFDAEWTRDAWSRCESPPHDPRWGLARDRDSGYVILVFATSPSLLSSDHPRLDFLASGSREEAESAYASLGRPPIRKQPWS